MLNAKPLKFTLIFLMSISVRFLSSKFDLYNPAIATPSYVSTPIADLSMITSKNANQLIPIATIVSGGSDYTLEAPVWSPNGLKLAAHDPDSIFVFNVSNFAKPTQVIRQSNPNSVRFSPDSELVIYIASDASVRSLHVFDLVSLRELYSIKDKVSSYQISPNGNLLAVWNDDGFISLFDLRTGTLKASLKGDSYSFTFSNDSSKIATIEHGEQGAKNAVWIWDVTTGQKLRKLEDWTAPPAHIAFSPIGNLLAVQYQDSGTIILWNPLTDQLMSTIEASYDDTGLGLELVFSSDAKFLASFGSGKIYLWQLSQIKRLVNIDNIDPNSYGGVFNKDNSLLVYWDFNDRENPPPGNRTQLWSITEARNMDILSDARDPQFSPDGTMLATWGKNGVEIWAAQ